MINIKGLNYGIELPEMLKVENLMKNQLAERVCMIVDSTFIKILNKSNDDCMNKQWKSVYSFTSSKMSAKKAHIVEAPVSKAAQAGIEEIKSGEIFVELFNG